MQTDAGSWKLVALTEAVKPTELGVGSNSIFQRYHNFQGPDLTQQILVPSEAAVYIFFYFLFLKLLIYFLNIKSIYMVQI